jgi:hypothetical protein
MEVIQLQEKTVSETIEELKRLKKKHGEEVKKKQRQAILQIHKLCEYNKRKVNLAVRSLGKYFNMLSRKLDVSNEIQQRKTEFLRKRSLELAEEDGMTTKNQIAARLGMTLRNYDKLIDLETKKIIIIMLRKKRETPKRNERKHNWENAIIEAYGNLAEAGRSLKLSGCYRKNDIKGMGVDVDKASRIGRQKFINDLMFVLKMTRFNKIETARILGVHLRTVRGWIKKLGITRGTIELYHAPFALVPTGKVINHDEIPIPNGKLNIRNFDWIVNRKLAKARREIELAHPDKGGSPEKLKEAVIKYRMIQKWNLMVRRRYGLPPRISKAQIAIPRTGRTPTRWETLKMRKPRPKL